MSCCSSLAFADFGDNSGRKHSTNSSGKAPFSCFFANSASLRLKGFGSGKALCSPLVKAMPWNVPCVLLEGRGLCQSEKKAGKFNAFSFQSSCYTSAFRVPRIKLVEIESSDRSLSLRIFLRNIFH